MKITVEVIQVSFGNDMEKIKAKTKVDATRREDLEKNVFEAITNASYRGGQNKGQGGI